MALGYVVIHDHSGAAGADQSSTKGMKDFRHVIACTFEVW